MKSKLFFVLIVFAYMFLSTLAASAVAKDLGREEACSYVCGGDAKWDETSDGEEGCICVVYEEVRSAE